MRRILIVEDHEVVRDALAGLLGDIASVQVVGTAPGVRGLSALVLDLSPDIILTDLMLEDGSAIEILRVVRRERLPVRVIVLTGVRDLFAAREALAGGAMGYVLKGQPTSELIGAIETVACGRKYVSPKIAAQLPDGTIESGARAGLQLLTPREAEVLRFLAHGYSNHEVAAGLCISIKTLETHRSNMNRKLALRNTVDLVRFAVAHGIGSAPLPQQADDPRGAGPVSRDGAPD